MSLSQVLLEGRKDDFLSKFRDKFNNEELKRIFLLSRDLAPNHKYLSFLGDVLESGNINYDSTKDIIEKFIKYQKVLPTQDIYLFQSLNDIQDEINAHENKVRRQVKELDGADQVYEDERFTVVTPKNHKTSCYYGSGTKWCTASMNGDSHFDKYNQDGKLFYIIDKKAKSNDRFYKVALLNKYDGDQVFYDAPDKSFKDGWILGTEEWDKINIEIQSYLQSNFKREIEIFKDKEATKLELERIRKQQQAERTRRKIEQQEERKRLDSWNVENDTEESNLANAIFKVIQEDGVNVNEEDGESIYSLIRPYHHHYGLTIFEWFGEDEYESRWAVGNWEQAWEAGTEYVQSLWDDMGAEAFSNSFVEGYIDSDMVSEYFRESFEEDVENNHDVYFNDDDLPLSDDQEELISNLEKKIEALHNKIDSIRQNDEEDDDIDGSILLIEEEIEETENEIEDIKSSPEGEPTQTQIDDAVDNLMYDVNNDPISHITDMGLDIDNFINVDELIDGVLNMDGMGPSLSPYDGEQHEVKINDIWYYVYRVD
jgi:hypothetical protein